MALFFGKKKRAYAVKDQKWTFEIADTQKLHFLLFGGTNFNLTNKQCNYDNKYQCNSESYKQHGFLVPTWWMIRSLYLVEKFFQQERLL